MVQCKWAAHKGLKGGSRLATKNFQIMLLNEAETSAELNLGIYGSWNFHFVCPNELVLQIATLKHGKSQFCKYFFTMLQRHFIMG